MLIWALYPPHKRPKIINIEKAFGHTMTLKVGEIDPIVIVNIGINISKVNKAQMKLSVKERNTFKLKYEI